MAEIVGVFAVSHTPVMTQMPDAPPGDHRDEAFAAIRRVGDDIRALRPDAVVLVSDDHLHNFFTDNMPAFCVGAAQTYPGPVERWLKVEHRTYQGDAKLGAHIVDSLLEQGFDPSFSQELTLDHGMVTPLELAGVADAFPVVPVQVNCVQPPLPRMARCVAFGAALGEALRSYPGPARIAVLATGGVSHDVGTPRMGFINEAFDREFLRLLQAGEAQPLTRFAQDEVNTAGNGAEEVRNWLVAHGAAGCAGFELWHYRAMHAWYTGIAVGSWVGRA